MGGKLDALMQLKGDLIGERSFMQQWRYARHPDASGNVGARDPDSQTSRSVDEAERDS